METIYSRPGEPEPTTATALIVTAVENIVGPENSSNTDPPHPRRRAKRCLVTAKTWWQLGPKRPRALQSDAAPRAFVAPRRSTKGGHYCHICTGHFPGQATVGKGNVYDFSNCRTLDPRGSGQIHKRRCGEHLQNAVVKFSTNGSRKCLQMVRPATTTIKRTTSPSLITLTTAPIARTRARLTRDPTSSRSPSYHWKTREKPRTPYQTTPSSPS